MTKNFFFKSLLAAGSLLSALQAQANFTYEGTLVDSAGSPVVSNLVQFTLEVMSPGAEACVLYKEYQNVDMSTSNGYFSLNVGAGTMMGTFPALQRVFQNQGMMTGLSCGSGATYYQPGFADARKLRVSVTISGGTTDVLGSLTINPVPMAENARTLGAFEAGNLLRAVDGSSNPAPIPAFDPGQMAELIKLIGGTSTLYAPAGGSGATGVAGGDLVGSYPNPSLMNTGVTAGSYGSAISVPSLSVDPKGRVTSISNIPITGLLPGAGMPGSYLRSNGSTWMSQNIMLTEIRNSLSVSPFITTPCAPNQHLNWSTVTDAFECQAINGLDASMIASGIFTPYRLGNGTPTSGSFLRGDGQWMPEMDPKIGSMAINTVPRWNGSSLMSGSITDTGGMIGIGTNSPMATLTVNGTLRINDDMNPCNGARGGVLRQDPGTGKLQMCDGMATFVDVGGQGPESSGGGSTADFAYGDTVFFATASSFNINLMNIPYGTRKKLIINSASSGTYTFNGSCAAGNTYYKPANTAVTSGYKVGYEIYRANNGSCYIDWGTYQ